MLFVLLLCQRNVQLNQKSEKERVPWAGSQPQSPQCLRTSQEFDFADHGFLSLLFSSHSGWGCFFDLSPCHQQGNYLFTNSFIQVPIYLSIYHVPSIVLIMINTGDKMVIKIKSLSLRNLHSRGKT